jgi:hypothetical protein
MYFDPASEMQLVPKHDIACAKYEQIFWIDRPDVPAVLYSRSNTVNSAQDATQFIEVVGGCRALRWIA